MKSRRFVIPILLILAVALVSLWFKARVEKLHGPGLSESTSGISVEQPPEAEGSEAADIQAASNILAEIPAQTEVQNARLKEGVINNPAAATNLLAPAAPATSVANSTVSPPPATPPSPPPTTMNLTNAPVIPPGIGRPYSGP